MVEDMIGGGTGLYTMKETALYTRIHPITLSRWCSGNDSGKRVLPVEDVKIITFPDFVQALAVRNLRVIHRLALPKIRDAVKRATDEYGVMYPLAVKHTVYLFDGQLWIKPDKTGNTIIQISGKQHGQTGIPPLIERFMIDVSFDKETGLANHYTAFRAASNSNRIVMDPKLRFGEPLVEGCGYTPESLFEAAKTEGSIELAAKAYGVTEDQVGICVDYFDYLLAA